MPETVCQLCGVSFELARCRRPTSPRAHAIGDPYAMQHGWSSSPSCGADAGGCTARPRSPVFAVEGPTFEHVAGPGCSRSGGYGGYAISFEEMEGCREVQFLAPKSAEEWGEEVGDAEWEKEGGYFLTGVGEGAPDGNGVDVWPVRHGAARVKASNIWKRETRLLFEAEQGMLEDHPGLGVADSVPFHPWCFRIFEYISAQKLGDVDAHGLFMWRVLDCSSNEAFFKSVSREFAVRNNRNRAWNGGWHHERGTEYLAANPLDVPGLKSIIDQFRFNQEIAGDFPLDITRHEVPNEREDSARRVDLFQRLPSELRFEILEYLASKDVANLRLVSGEFRRLPASLFRRFLIEDMPWFLEARGLPADQVHWFRLYRAAKLYGGNLKGLKNRKRIWEDVEEIVTRISAYRRGGIIRRWDPQSTMAPRQPRVPSWAQIWPPGPRPSQDLFFYQAASYLDSAEPIGAWLVTDPLLDINVSLPTGDCWLSELCTQPRSFCSYDARGLNDFFDYLVGVSFRDSIDPCSEHGVVPFSSYAFLCRHLYYAKLEFLCGEEHDREEAATLPPLWRLCAAVLPPAVRDFLLTFDDPTRSNPAIPGWSYEVTLATEEEASGIDERSDPVLDIVADAVILAACSGHAGVCKELKRVMPELLGAAQEKMASKIQRLPNSGIVDTFAREFARLLPSAVELLPESIAREPRPHTRRAVAGARPASQQRWEKPSSLAMKIAEKVALTQKPVEHPSLRVYTAGYEEGGKLFHNEFGRFWWRNTPLIGCHEVANMVLRFLKW
ncbi:hypothetical protein B0J12DRAFT_762816 [Macrophomina phaseolina]|uniref:F-box domain-containing protein n=1 Tax=Macrophomina phaseolina TaxID=35725 RepID=A0ABQ8G0N9_9PEZI|nr:hypothetical protein B0J12DRAFT_762816 [Macrophomina phaseolina]